MDDDKRKPQVVYYDDKGNPVNDCEHDWQRRVSNFDSSGYVLFCEKCRALKAAAN